MSQATIRAAIYARVSSDQQSKACSIGSQVEALDARAHEDGVLLDAENRFLDEGYSGATLVRPALERLRDAVYAGAIDRVYVHSPDRLARKYAYQVLLVDEFQRAGVEVVFLNHALGNTPEEDLLLQMQGMIAEYERAKILERSRRGKRHAARRGLVSVLSGAPYGYRYLAKRDTGEQASYQVVLEEARVVRQIFEWVGLEGASLGEVCRRLRQKAVKTRTGKAWWDRTTIWGMLRNPAYQGSAAYGKTHLVPRKAQLRPQRGQAEQPRKTTSVQDTAPEDQTFIEVPAIISRELFQAAAERLAENKRRNRQSRRGAKYLLQGLVQCGCCGYAYYGKPVSRKAAKGKTRRYAYYRCIGADGYRFGGQRVCQNQQVRTDRLEEAVWEDVRRLLSDPQRIAEEYQRRLARRDRKAGASAVQLKQSIQRVKRSITRLIDAYEEGLIDKAEFEPRIRQSKERLTKLEGEAQALAEAEAMESELRLAVGCLQEFAKQIAEGLDAPDWHTKREIIRALVKRIAVGPDEVRVVYRVSPRPFVQSPDRGSLQHCWRSDRSAAGECLPALV